MITLKMSHQQLHDVQADGYIFFCEQDAKLTAEQLENAQKFHSACQEVLDKTGFSGSQSSSRVITGTNNGKPVELIFVGLGKKNIGQDDRIEYYRRAVAKALREAEARKVTNLALPLLHAKDFGVDDCALAKETVIALEMARYQFNQFITDKKRHVPEAYTITFVAPEAHHNAIMVGVEFGTRIGHAVNQARQWCDLPADILTPTHLAEQAEAVAAGHDNLVCKIFTQKECNEMGMGGLEAVSRGSNHESRFIILEYKPENKTTKTIGLVGKGVTFDSGGLGIKPGHAMEDMKDDMAGAAGVIATMQALAHLKPNVNVVAVAPVTENMTGGSAFKPGDILSHYNGVTSEIKHTDAEGRLILADALAYITKHYKLDAVVNAATLTGACLYALGPFYAGMMSFHPDFAQKITHAGARSGDRVWTLPFHDDYKAAIVSEVADIRNTGKKQYLAGTVTAGLFLSNFVDDTPWVHLDIAGVSFSVPDRPYYRSYGSTGFGVRLFTDLIMNWQ